MRNRDQGFALILVIWSLVVLASLAAGFAFGVRHETRVAADMESIARAEAAATAALHTTVLALSATEREIRWRPNRKAHMIPWPEAKIVVRVQSEGGRIDINHAAPELLLGLFAQFAAGDDAQALTDALIDWRDSDDEPGPAGAEGKDYARAGYRYRPSNAPFRSVNELSRVMGFNNRLLDVVRPYLTVYSRKPRINADSADLVTLASVPGISQDEAQTFVSQREQTRDRADFSSLRNGRQYLDMRPNDKLLSVDIDVRLDAGLRRREHAVIQLNRRRGYNLLVRETRPADADQDSQQP